VFSRDVFSHLTLVLTNELGLKGSFLTLVFRAFPQAKRELRSN
jgi:hypothetical protein